MMPLHSSKKEALIQLTNCLSSCNLKTIKQLSDGKIFLSIIETVFPETTPCLQSEEKEADEHFKNEDKTMDQDSNESPKELGSEPEETELLPKDEGSVAAYMECAGEFLDVELADKSPEQISMEEKEVDNKSSPNNVDIKELSKRYEIIESFIDVKYHLQSRKLIAYEECLTENEFELAKVALFVVSEVVQHYVKVNNAIIQTLSHLDIKVQEDLKDCFNLFINDRSKINETDIKKLLSNRTSYRASPAKSSFVTPKRSCPSLYKRSPSPSASPLFYDNFSDSPLKTYFESPIFTRKDIITKDKEILKTRQNLYEEEIKSNALQLRVKELEKELKNKGNEIKSLKTTIKEIEELEKPEECKDCVILKERLSKKEKVAKELCEKIEFLEEQHETLKNDMEEDFEKFKVEVASEHVTAQYEFKEAEKRCGASESELEEMRFLFVKEELKAEQLMEDLKEKTKECEILKEKLSAAVMEVEKIPEYSMRGECIGGVIEKENEELRQRIKQLELIALSKDELVQFRENSSAVITEEKLQEPPDTCDIDKEDSSLSLSSKGSFIPNNFSPIQDECVGALWQQYNDSMTENNKADALKKCISQVESFIQKLETEFQKRNTKRNKSRANGSNGFVISPLIKELVVDFKSVKKSLLCLSADVEKQDVEIDNNNALSQNSEVIIDSGPVHSQCDTCLRKEEETPSSVLSSESHYSETLLEKTKELDLLNEQYLEKTKQLDILNEQYMEKTKKFDILNEQCLTTMASLRLKEKELYAFKRRYILDKKENDQTVKSLRQLEMEYQKLEFELKDMKKNESEMKRNIRKEKSLFKLHVKDMREKYSQLYQKCFALQSNIKTLREKNQKLREDAETQRDQNEKLFNHIEVLENRNQELRLKLNPEPSTSLQTRIVPYTQGGPTEHFVRRIPRTEPPSSHEEEANSSATDIEENITASALYARNLQNPFQLHTADEESFLNHSSIAGLSRNCDGEEPEPSRRNTSCFSRPEETGPNRMSELNRRNTLCMPHLQSCYPAEGVPLNPPTNRHLSSEVLDDASRDSESANREPTGKKRKVSEMRTPSYRSRLKFTPQSLTKLLKLTGSRRSRRPAPIKPKPE